MKNWLRPDFWKLKMKKWIHKLNEINYFNVLDDVFFDAWSDGEIRIAISPILVEADFTAWWRNWGDHFWIFVTALGHTCAYITGVNELNQSKLIFWIPILTCVQFIFFLFGQTHIHVHTSFFALRLDRHTHVHTSFFALWPDRHTRVHCIFYCSAGHTHTCVHFFFFFGQTDIHVHTSFFPSWIHVQFFILYCNIPVAPSCCHALHSSHFFSLYILSMKSNKHAKAC